MLDPAFVREHVDEVRTGLRNRGLDPDKSLEDIATLETIRRRLIPEVEGLKRQQNTAGDEEAKADQIMAVKKLGKALGIEIAEPEAAAEALKTFIDSCY